MTRRDNFREVGSPPTTVTSTCGRKILKNDRNIGVLQRKLVWRAPSTPEPQPRLSLRERAIDLARRSGTVRTKDLEAVGVPRQYPPMMCREGLLIRVGYGVYRAAAEDSRSEESRTSQMTRHDKPSDFYSE
nr:type IV toxin-antitoxin system AbiEi family antitoxin domain-containing protein [Sphingopyxis sp. Geo48]